MALETLTTFFGWLSVINIVILVFSVFAIVAMKKMIVRLHGRMFGIGEDDVMRTCYQYLGFLKIMTIVFSLSPWIALTMMGG